MAITREERKEEEEEEEEEEEVEEMDGSGRSINAVFVVLL